MDSGYLAPGDTLEDDYDVLKPLLPEEVIGIMDQMLCLEVGFAFKVTLRASGIHDAEYGMAGCVAHGSSALTVTVHVVVH